MWLELSLLVYTCLLYIMISGSMIYPWYFNIEIIGYLPDLWYIQHPWYFDISEIVGYLPHWMRYLHFACFDYQDLPEWRLIHVEFVQFHQNVIWSSEKWCWEFFRGGDPWRLIWEEEQKYLELSTEINYPSHSHEYFLFAKQWRLCIHYCAISLCLLEQPGNSLGTWHPLTMQ